MASLNGQTIASSYEQLLHVDRDGGGNSTTLVDVKDGDNGTTFALKLATDKIQVNGSSDLDGAVTINESGADVDFRVETTGNTHGFHIDAGNNVININRPISANDASTPDEVLALKTFYPSSGTDGSAGAGTLLSFYIPDDETNPIKGAGIAGLKENADDSNAETALAFYTSQNNATLDEAMRITSDGELLIKCGSLPTDFGDEKGQLVISSTDNSGANNYGVLQMQGHAIASDVISGLIAFYDHNTEIARMQGQYQGSNQGDLLFYTNGSSGVTERMRIKSDGVITTTGDFQPGADIQMADGRGISFADAHDGV